MTESEIVPTFRERVEAGAAYLDGVLPGWWEKIDLETLYLKSSCRCVLGQLAVDVGSDRGEGPPTYWDWRRGWLRGIDPLPEVDAVRFGFTDSPGDFPSENPDDYDEDDWDAEREAVWDRLTEAWRTYITERRAS